MKSLMSSRVVAILFSALFGLSMVALPSYANAKEAKNKTHQEVVSQVNINKASIKQLTQLKGVGEKKAAAIVQFRDKYGKFKSIDQLAEVKGISEKTIEKNKHLIQI